MKTGVRRQRRIHLRAAPAVAGLGLVLLMPPAPAWAQDPATPEPAGAAATTPISNAELLSGTRQAVRSTFEWLARGVDSWFGDKPFEQGGAVTDGRVSLNVLERHGDRTDWGLRFNARFRLPNADEWGYLFVGRDNERELVTDRPDAATSHQRLQAEAAADQKFFLGLGLWLQNLNLDGRIGVRGALKPYAQVRYRRPWQIGPHGLAEFRQTLFWTVDDQIGSTTALSYEHALSPQLALRWLNLGTITRRTDRYEWSSVLGGYRLMGPQRVLALEALAQGRQGSGVDVTEYGLRTRWEQPLHHDWVIGELIVGRFWPRPDAASVRRGVWALGVGVQLRF